MTQRWRFLNRTLITTLLVCILAVFTGLAPASGDSTTESMLSEHERTVSAESEGIYSSLVTSEGKWAKEKAIELLQRYPNLQANPYGLIVRFVSGVPTSEIEALLAGISGSVVEYYEIADLYLVETPYPLAWAKDYLGSSELVGLAELDETLSATELTNDPRLSDLWGLTGGHGIDVATAWPLAVDLEEVVVAVIDSGVDNTHPDLADVMWSNADEIADNGIDDDGNGYIDDTYGWDFVNNDNEPEDGNGHGTHVAGTIAAVRDNALGIVGVANNVQVMALRFLDNGGYGYTSNAISAVNYAVANAAPISNNSWGGGGFNTSLYNAIEAAESFGHTFVAAAGNSGRNIDASPSYPAAYDLDNIISVAAISSSGNLAGFSNYGYENVDIAAPGVGILSSVSHQYCGQVSPADCYASFSGTSMASPHVAGVAALLAGAIPGITPEGIKSILEDSSRINPLLDGAVGFGGELDAGAAMTIALATGSMSFPGHTQGQTVLQGDTITLTAVAISDSGDDISSDIVWRDLYGSQIGVGPSVDYVAAIVGNLRLSAEATDSNGALVRGTASFNIAERQFSLVSPDAAVEPLPGSILPIEWIWEGDAVEVADLIARPVLLQEEETTEPMPDIWGQNDISEFSVDISEDVAISDVTVGLRFSHTYVADLEISLIHPDGTEVRLAYRNGGGADDYGTGDESCNGELAYFDDNASESISERSAPFVGLSRPEEPLSTFEGKQAKGVWVLRLVDDWDMDEGTFFCFQLEIGSTTESDYLIGADIRLAEENASWLVPDPVPYALEGSYRVGFGDSSLGAAWSPCCVELVASNPYRPPTAVTAEAGDEEVTVSWVASEPNGEAVPYFYSVTGVPGGFCEAFETACVVEGLNNGVSHTFSVVTYFSDGGVSDASEITTPVTPSTVPSQPLSPEANVVGDEVLVTWESPLENGGLPISGYVVTALPGQATCTTQVLSCRFSKLPYGAAYRFTVFAFNSNGDGIASEATKPEWRMPGR